MVKLVFYRGIDFALLDFSKSHVEGNRIFVALEAGLSNMREAGLIRKFYTGVNFYREELAD